MGSATSTRARSVSEFPDPHKFGIWWNESTFVVYRNLSLIKAAITNKTNYEGITQRDAKIFEHDGKEWQLIYHVPQGINRLDHELWKSAAPKTGTVSDAAVEAAIASITGAKS
jgi:hypothetical protein